MSKKRILHLHLKFKHFDQIFDGSKDFEYRKANDYWRKRFAKRPPYEEVWLYRGYQKAISGKTLLKRKFYPPVFTIDECEPYGPGKHDLFALKVDELPREQIFFTDNGHGHSTD